jgi:Rha family phage regulatory protein
MEGFDRCLSGKEHKLNQVDCSPIPVLARDYLAVGFVMSLYRRGVSKFPRRIDQNWSFGWTMSVLWGYLNRLAKNNIEPTPEMLTEMLYGITDEDGLPFGAAQAREENEPEEALPMDGGLGVFDRGGKLMVGSRSVAAAFGKRHCDVLRDVKSLDCSKDFHERNFALMMETIDIGKGAKRESPVIHMTRDGFAFLAMGYTGKKAALYKEAYIERFNEMEAELRAREKPALPEPTPAIGARHRSAKKFYMPEEAAEELGLSGYRALYLRMEALGMVVRGRKRVVPVPEFSKYVRLKSLGTKKGNSYQRVVVTPCGLDYLRAKL